MPIALTIPVAVTDEHIAALSNRRSGGTAALQALQGLFRCTTLRLTDDELVWIRFVLTDGAGSQGWTLDPTLSDEVARTMGPETTEAIRDATLHVLGQSSSDHNENLRGLFHALGPFSHLPRVEVIEAFRQIRPTSGDESEVIYNGIGLVRGLQKLERPTIERHADEQRFLAINRFLQAVLDDPTAQLKVPHNAMTLHVSRGGLTLPIENLGTGIHQVVILAAAATLLEDTVVCMEEPEVHLHPLLQRKLLRYLAQETSNQYLIATHSAHLLDYEHANVFHVQHTDEGTEVKRAATPQQLADICADLGYRPSDLLQANAIVWVEGPSDRLYLRHWLSLIDPTLIEGIHYSMMFYGGRLLNHLTATDPEVDDFISLRRLNRHIVVLMDSDKRSARSEINATKQRVCAEFDAENYPGFAWVTHGRTIENYIPKEVLHDALAALYSEARGTYNGSRWKDAIGLNPKHRVDKVKLAHRVTQGMSEGELSDTDLRAELDRLTDFIRSANGLTNP